MSDGQRDGVFTSLRQLGADATGQQLQTVSELQTVEEGFVEETNNKEPRKEEMEEEDSDDDPLLQELEDELEQTTFWKSNFARQQLTEETQQSQQPTLQTYKSRIAYTLFDCSKTHHFCCLAC